MTEEALTRTDPAPDGDAEEQTGDPAPAAAPATVPGQAATAPDAAPPAGERRTLKLVVSCRPEAEAEGYRVLLGLVADGCDPVFRNAVADGLTAALDEVPALLAEAEERWRAQPRYPAAAKPRTTGARQRTAAAPAGEAAAPAPSPGATPAKSAPAPKAAPAGQMALFG